jgi:hypothetical protein
MAGLRPGEADAHPVLTALMHAVETAANGDRSLLAKAVEARQAELFGEPAVEAASSVMLMAARLLGVEDEVLRNIADDAGTALTFVSQPRDPELARRAYAAFRDHVSRVPVKARPAFLHLATVPLRLKNPDAPQWRRQLALMRAAWFGFPNI